MALDFEIIATEDPKKLVIVDSSDTIGNTVEVTLPDTDTPITLPINSNLVNTFYSSDLNLSEDELPDGVYIISLGEETPKNHLRTAVLKRSVSKLYLRCYIDCKTPPTFTSKITDIELNLEAAHAYLKMGDPERADYFYKRTKEKVEKLLKCKTCE